MFLVVTPSIFCSCDSCARMAQENSLFTIVFVDGSGALILLRNTNPDVLRWRGSCCIREPHNRLKSLEDTVQGSVESGTSVVLTRLPLIEQLVNTSERWVRDTKHDAQILLVRRVQRSSDFWWWIRGVRPFRRIPYLLGELRPRICCGRRSRLRSVTRLSWPDRRCKLDEPVPLQCLGAGGWRWRESSWSTSPTEAVRRSCMRRWGWWRIRRPSVQPLRGKMLHPRVRRRSRLGRKRRRGSEHWPRERTTSPRTGRTYSSRRRSFAVRCRPLELRHGCDWSDLHDTCSSIRVLSEGSPWRRSSRPMCWTCTRTRIGQDARRRGNPHWVACLWLTVLLVKLEQ